MAEPQVNPPNTAPLKGISESSQDYFRHKKEQSNVAVGSFFHQVFSGLTFGLSSVAASPLMSEETRKNYFQYQRNHPIESAFGYGIGAAAGTIATLGLTTPARLAQFAEAGIEAANVTRATRLYQLMQGIPEAATLESAATSGIAGGLAFGGAQFLNDAALDPTYVQANLSKYSLQLLESGGIGLVTNAGIYGIGKVWNKWRGGDKQIVGEAMENNIGNKGVGLGQSHDVNQLTLKNSLNRIAPAFDKIKKGQRPEIQDAMELAFYGDLQTNKTLYEAVANGDQNLPTLLEDWKTSFLAQQETNSFGANATDKAITALNHQDQVVQVKADTSFLNTLSAQEAQLQAQADIHFADPLHNQAIPINLLKDLTQDGGRVERIQNLIDQKVNPRAAMEVLPNESGAEFEARVAIAELPNNKPRPETIEAIQTYFNGFKDKINHAGEALTPRYAYEAIQEFRQGAEKYFRGLRKKLDYVIDAQGDALLGSIKKELFNIIQDPLNFGEFGILAGKKTAYLSNVNTIFENMYRNLEIEKVLPKAPFLSEERGPYVEKLNKRAGFIRDVFEKLQKVSSEHPIWRYTTQKVIGDFENTKKLLFTVEKNANGELTSGYMQALHDLLPTNESKVAINQIQNALDQTINNIKKISALNNGNVNSIFGKGNFFGQDLTKSHGAMSITNRLIRASHDFVGGLVVPQDTRFGVLQLMRIGMDSFTRYGFPVYGPLLGLEELGSVRAKQILYGLMQDGNKLAKETKTFKNLTISIGNKILSAGKTGARQSPNLYNTYSTRLNEAENIHEVETRFEKISKNITNMQQDPSLYAERMHFALNGIRALSPQIAEEAQKRLCQQMGLVAKIFPINGSSSPYKPNISITEKARFLDNVDAITNPAKIMQMIGDGAVNKEQLAIFKTVHANLWQKTLQEVSKQIFYTNPPPEARARAYGIFGFKNIESETQTLMTAQQMIEVQFQAKHPRPKPRFPKANIKFGQQSTALTPQGVNP